MLVNDMHQGLLSIFAAEFIRKHRFEMNKDEYENPFFILLKYRIGDDIPDGDELSLIWTEFARKICNLQWYTHLISEGTKRYIIEMNEKSPLNYNQLEFKQKMRILLEIMECAYETEVLHEFMANKMEEMSTLQKERNDLTNEIKADEQEYYTIKMKIESFEKSKGYFGSNKKGGQQQFDAERKSREISKMENQMKAVQQRIDEKQERIEDIGNQLLLTTQTAQRIGQDCNKTEYWVFFFDPSRVYVKYPAVMQSTDSVDSWYYYDSKTEIDNLMKSLNPRGVREKNLLDTLKTLIKNNSIYFEPTEEEKQAEKEEAEKKKQAEKEAKELAKKQKQKQLTGDSDELDDDFEDFKIEKKKDKNKEEIQEEKKEEEAKIEPEEGNNDENKEDGQDEGADADKVVDEKDEQNNDEQVELKDEGKSTKKKLGYIRHEDPEDDAFWLTKVLEYEGIGTASENVRTTRRKAQATKQKEEAQ
mmetsp:Transcript_24403/g.21585  ORF Transcript_24403/g.21585 Transcript_24403/m.21585 type:complete len:475 (-) Transcript_24403:1751-3175(-)